MVPKRKLKEVSTWIRITLTKHVKFSKILFSERFSKTRHSKLLKKLLLLFNSFCTVLIMNHFIRLQWVEITNFTSRTESKTKVLKRTQRKKMITSPAIDYNGEIRNKTWNKIKIFLRAKQGLSILEKKKSTGIVILDILLCQ